MIQIHSGHNGNNKDIKHNNYIRVVFIYEKRAYNDRIHVKRVKQTKYGIWIHSCVTDISPVYTYNKVRYIRITDVAYNGQK